jgi:ABC-2 type transport system permease protein
MLTIAAFELRNRLRLISTWVYFLVFGSAGALWIALVGGYFSDAHLVMGSGRTLINSPFALANMFAVLGILGVSVIAAIMGRAVQQDFEHGTHSLLFSTPLTRSAYLGGRFLGAAATAVIIFSSIALGAWLATALPGLDAVRVGPNHLAAYLWPYLIILLPNILVIGGLFFTLAALSRRMLPVYVGSVLVVLAWLVSLDLMRDVDNRTVAALLDPFGMRALLVLTRYWSVAERDVRPIPLADVVLWNRLLWCSIAAVVGFIGASRFSFREASEVGGARADVTEARRDVRVVRVEPQHGHRLALFASMTWVHFREIIGNVYFGVLLLAGLGTMAVTAWSSGPIYGTKTWPLTFTMLDQTNGVFTIFALAIITFYAGELVWRERDARMDQIVDATPLASGVALLAKFAALMLITLVLQVVLVAGAMALQIAHGYWHLELALYAKSFLGIYLIDFWLVVALAFAVQAIVNHKYVGHLIMVLYYLLINFCAAMGLEDVLYRYGETLEPPYSDMNGFGHALVRTRVLEAYWSAAALLLLLGAHACVRRGSAPPPARLR